VAILLVPIYSISGYCGLLVAIDGYWWLFYQWLLMIILLMAIDGYFISGY
jgi:hypothetical protein